MTMRKIVAQAKVFEKLKKKLRGLEKFDKIAVKRK